MLMLDMNDMKLEFNAIQNEQMLEALIETFPDIQQKLVCNL